jgi:hypothetical protein
LLSKYPTKKPSTTPVTVIASVSDPMEPRPTRGLISEIYCGTEWNDSAMPVP